MPPEKRNGLARHLKYAIIILTVVLVLLVGVFYSEFQTLRRSQLLQSRQAWLAALRSRTPLTLTSPDQIQPWMTFDYVNKVFKTPPEYFQTSFSITDKEYPRLFLFTYARRHGIPASSVVSKVKAAVQNFLATNKNSSTK